MTTKPKQQPVYKVHHGRVSAAVWENERKDKEDTFHNVTFDCSYKDGEEYKSTLSYGIGTDLQNLERCLFDVKVWAANQRQK